MTTALIPRSELTLLASLLGQDVTDVSGDGFHTVVRCQGGELVLFPTEIPVDHPDTSLADVVRLSVEIPRRALPYLTSVASDLGMVVEVAIARSMLRIGRRQWVPPSQLLNTQLPAGVEFVITLHHPAQAAYEGEEPSAGGVEVLCDIGLRVKTARRRFCVATSGFFTHVTLGVEPPDGWENSVQYVRLDRDGTLAV